MRLKAIQAYLKSKNMPFEYWEDNDSGSKIGRAHV